MEKKGEGGWKEKRTLPPVPWSGSVAFTMNTERPTGVFCKEKIEKKHARLIERCDFFFRPWGAKSEFVLAYLSPPLEKTLNL